jgi:hypothetical protein
MLGLATSAATDAIEHLRSLQESVRLSLSALDGELAGIGPAASGTDTLSRTYRSSYDPGHTDLVRLLDQVGAALGADVARLHLVVRGLTAVDDSFGGPVVRH